MDCFGVLGTMDMDRRVGGMWLSRGSGGMVS